MEHQGANVSLCWRSKIGPRSIPKIWHSHWHLPLTMTLDARCGYTLSEGFVFLKNPRISPRPPPILDSRIPLPMVGTSHGLHRNIGLTTPECPSLNFGYYHSRRPPPPPDWTFLWRIPSPQITSPRDWSLAWRTLTLRRPRCAPGDYRLVLFCAQILLHCGVLKNSLFFTKWLIAYYLELSAILKALGPILRYFLNLEWHTYAD